MLHPRVGAHDFDLESSLLSFTTRPPLLFKLDASRAVDQREAFTLPVINDATSGLQNDLVNKALADRVTTLKAFDDVDARQEPRPSPPAQKFALWDTTRELAMQDESRPVQLDPFVKTSTLPAHTESEVLESALISLSGLESPLFAWDETKDRLVWRSDLKGKQKQGARIRMCSDQSSQRLVESVLTVGTATVRLDEVALSLVKPKSAMNKFSSSVRRDEKPSKSSHAVAAALSSFLAWTREQLSTFSSSNTNTIDLYVKLAPLQSALVALCNLFSRPSSKAPPYHFLPLSTPSLLSHLHHFLQHQLNSSVTPPLLHQAIAAWLLDGAVAEWQRGWFDWLGLTDRIGVDWSELGIEVKRKARAKADESENEEDADVDYVLHTSQLPNFIPRAAALELFEAGRALRILRRAAPDHPLCRADNVNDLVAGLAWTEADLRRRESVVADRVSELESEIDRWLDRNTRANPSRNPTRSVWQHTNIDFPQAFERATDEASPWRSSGQVSSLNSFLAARLDATDKATLSILPRSTPVLSALLSRSLFTPLQTYARLPSTCLLSLLFSDLSLGTHFEVLRGFVFLGYEPFSRRVKEALFALPEDKQVLRHGRPVDFGVGMGVYLHESSVWPPGGAQLGMALRTALKDALKDLLDHKRNEQDEAARRVWQSLDGSLSFAYEQASEQDETKWKDPNSLEALDFLFVNYRVPSPLDLILTPHAMRKYHGIFKHLLRLLRVDCISRQIWQTVHKPSNDSGELLLSDSSEARTLLVNVSYEAQNLVTSLCSYSFDCAVETNYQSFKKALNKIRFMSMQSMRGRSDAQVLDDERGESSDEEVDDDLNLDFDHWNLDTLSLVHQEFISRVEKGLMLKRAQAPLRQLVEAILTIVMDLGRKVNAWRRGNVKEVMHELMSLRSKLRQVASTLVKVLGALDDRGPISTTRPTVVDASSILNDVEMEFGIDWVQQLLVRLDGPTRFYSSMTSNSTKAKHT
ncbi:hypothetical protein OIV83_002208 [Microbotryomycetes sp. JL201]|nr:hypothetical protein OIV83_002208 [Microbotryomycetes sp. JL201]